jgi:hypothetical protein
MAGLYDLIQITLNGSRMVIYEVEVNSFLFSESEYMYMAKKQIYEWFHALILLQSRPRQIIKFIVGSTSYLHEIIE